MSVQVRSGATTDLLTVDATSKAARVTMYGTDGRAITELATYSTTFRGASGAGITPFASATAPIAVLQGSATKTVRVWCIAYSIAVTTGVALPVDVWAAKFSSFSGGTTTTAPTVAKHDSNDASATAAPILYTGAATATLLDSGAYLTSDKYALTTGSATVAQTQLVNRWIWGSSGSPRPVVLRGTAQYIGVGVSTSVGTTPLMEVVITWTEE
jgi:hypothetical protein